MNSNEMYMVKGLFVDGTRWRVAPVITGPCHSLVSEANLPLHSEAE